MMTYFYAKISLFVRKRKALLSLLLLALCALSPQVAAAGDLDLSGFDTTVTCTLVGQSIGFENEGTDKLFDGTASTKWCTTFADSITQEVQFQTSKAGVLGGYIIVTANDNAENPGRNPNSWVLYGFSKNQNFWELIDAVDADTTLKDVNFTPFLFKTKLLAESYDHFRWVIYSNKGADVVQVSEFIPLMALDFELCTHKNAYGTSALVKTEAVEPTCTEPGSMEYYTCPACKKIFHDKDGQSEFASDETTTLPATGHHFVNGECDKCHTVDNRFSAFTRKGVNISISDHPEAESWHYDSVSNRIVSNNKQLNTNCDFSFTVEAGSDFMLTFDYGLFDEKQSSNLRLIIDGHMVSFVNKNNDRYFSYVFNSYQPHTVTLQNYKDGQETTGDSQEAYIKNIVASTDIDTSKLQNVMYITQDADTLVINYGKNEYLNYIYENGDVVPFSLNKYVKIDESMKDYEITSAEGLFTPFEPIGITGLGNLNTSKLTDLNGMFYNCNLVQEIDFSSFDTRNVTDISGMFYGCNRLKQLDLSSFNTQNVTCMQAMFAFCDSLQSVNLSSFDTRNVIDMSGLFSNCGSLKQINLSSFDTRNVTDMSGMFYCCSSLEHLDLSSFDTRNVTNMSVLFYYCDSLRSVNLSSFDTRNVVQMSYMFFHCKSLRDLDLSLFDTRNVTDMSSMFTSCSSLKELDLSSFNTENVMSMNYQFLGCMSLKELDLTSFDTRNVIYMNTMFANCGSLTTIYTSDKFVVMDNVSSRNMFTNNKCLIGATAFNSAQTDGSMANYHTGYFKTYCQTGEIKHELFGENLALGTLNLVDGEVLKINAPFTVAVAQHVRALSATESGNYASDRWGSICLPYAIQTPENCQLYTYGGITRDEKTREAIIVVEETSALAAGTPALFCVRDGSVSEINFCATDVAVADSIIDSSANAINGLYLAGTFNSTPITEGYVLTDNRMERVSVATREAASVEGLRAYLAVNPEASAPTDARLLFEASVSTGITDIDSLTDMLNSGNAEVYDINGRRQQSLQQGVNIIRTASGKSIKVLVK